MATANAFGFDLGAALREREVIADAKQNRTHRNTLMDWKTEDREAARQRARSLNVLRERASNGDRDAMLELNAFDPSEAKALMENINGMDDRQRKIAKENANTMGRIAAYVLQSENPEQAYQLALENLPPEIADKAPEKYSENAMNMVLARAAEMSDLLENPERIQFGDKERLYRHGRQVDETNALVKGGAGGGSGSGLKSSDESLMFRMAGELLGGIFDQQGNLQNLDPQQRSNVQSIVTEAARLRTNGEAGTAGEAVTMAARKLGLEVPNLNAGGTIDRNKLLSQYSQPQ